MSCVRNALMALSLALVSALSWAEVSQEQEAKIVAGLKNWRPDLNFTNVMATPIEGLFHVQVVGGPSIFTSADGTYFIQGDLNKTSLGTFENWLDTVYAPIRRDLIQSASVDDMVVYKAKGETKAVLHVFTDIDCGYCRKLHQEVPTLNDIGVEVRYLAFPRAGMGSDSEQKITSVWCSDDPLEAMTRSKQGYDLPAKECKTNAIATHMNMVAKMGLTGTPSMVLSDGTLIPGYLPAAQLKRRLGL
ncbi:DsbC family protein [bacterium SCSIO 12696]|nr:DsbC family protein [bacterium SCSIO 12696]